MCNRLHEDSTPIPKRGIGWRLVSTVEDEGEGQDGGTD